jgi:hypothetical protein
MRGARENATSGNYAGLFSIYTTDSGGSNLERFHINSSGNVGIGTTSPAAKLHVNGGEIYVQNTDYGRVMFVRGSTNIWAVGPRNTDDLYIRREGGSANVIFDGGNVGIGVTAPTASLQVASSSALAAGNPSIILQGSNNTERISIRSTSASVFVAQFANGTLASPTAVTTGNFLGSYQFGGYAATLWTRGAQVSGSAAGTWTDTSTPANIVFETVPSGSTGFLERMRIDSSGNIGIGTASPANRLSVAGSGTSLFHFLGEGNTYYVLRSRNSADSAFADLVLRTDDFVIETGTSGAVTERLRLGDTGNFNIDSGTFFVDALNDRVGIGTTSPTFKLSVSGSGVTSGIFVLDTNSSEPSPVIKVQGNRIDNNSSQSFSGGLVLERYNSNGSSGLVSGNVLGTIYFGGNYNTTPTFTYPASISAIAEANWTSTSAASTGLAFFTGATGQTLGTANVAFGTERMRINSSGNVGIGTTSPAARLDVSGSAAFGVGSTTGFGITLREHTTGTVRNWSIRDDAGVDRLRFSRGSSDAVFWDVLKVSASDQTADQFWYTNGAQRMQLSSAGLAVTSAFTVTGGAAIGGAALSATGNQASQLIANLTSSISGAGTSFGLRVAAGTNASDYALRVLNQAGTTDYLFVKGDGAVNIPGSLSKGSGSFRIEHPLPSKSETHELVHSFIEGPQADLIYRGKATLVNGIASVNIDTSATMTEGTFEALCREVQCFTTNESGWTAIRGKVTGNILTIQAQDSTCTDEISWMVIGERQDKHMMDTEWTDENGKVIVEPLKPVKLSE